MSLKRKLIGNSVANTTGFCWSAVLQFASVPILTSTWGVEKYGSWLILTTIPTYLALSDFGFTEAASSDITMSIARGDRNAALSTFQSVSVMIVSLSVTAAAIASTLLWLPVLPVTLPFWWPRANAEPLFLLIAFSLLALSARVILVGFRSSGHYAIGTMVYSGFAFAEGVLVLLTALSGGDFVACGFTYVFARLVSIVVLAILLKRLVPWLPLGFAHARRTELYRLLHPALGAMAVPTALAINIQGVLLVTGAVVSPTAVAVLGPVRTVSRIAVQAVGIVNRATMPEFSAASAKGNERARRQLLRLNALMIVLVLLPGAILFALFGRDFVEFWTGGRIVPGKSFVTLMALAMLLHGCWYFGSNLLLAINAHVRFSYIMLLIAAVSVLIAIPAGYLWGLNGIAMGLLASEGIGTAGLALSWKALQTY